MRIKSIKILLLVGIIIPVSCFSEEPLAIHLNKMRDAIDIEIEQYSVKIREMSGDFSINLLNKEEDVKVYEKLTRLLADLPEPGDGIDPYLHYRAIIEGIIDQQIVNPIISLTHSSLIPLNTLGSERLDTTSYNLILTNTLTFVERLSEIKMEFLDQAVPFYHQSSSP